MITPPFLYLYLLTAAGVERSGKKKRMNQEVSKTITELKTSGDNLEVEYEVISAIQERKSNSIANSLSDIEARIEANQDVINQLNQGIGRLTNHADGLDYTIAVASGLLTGMIDVFFVGEFNFSELKGDANKFVNEFIEKYAKLIEKRENFADKCATFFGKQANKRGRKKTKLEDKIKKKGLEGAISFLEKKFPVDQDNVWKGLGFSCTRLHHLDDIAHHPTVFGLIASIAVTFFRTAFFNDEDGKWYCVVLKTDKNKLAETWVPIIISGVLRWLVYLAESKYIEMYSKELPKPIHKLAVALSYSPAVIKILNVSCNWFGHLVSDMGGSKNTSGGGMGISGLFISLLKGLSSLPILKNTRLPKMVSDLYSQNKWDFRAELAITKYLEKQSIPVILNELFVRTFYFVRYLIAEYKKNDSWNAIDWKRIVPWRNRTITRMMTIASGTFVTVDATDAAIRASMKSGVQPTMFFANMVLRVNFVGLGRFSLAIGTDVYMGCKCERLRNERLYRQSEQLMLSSAKLYYKQAGMWITAKDAEDAINQMEMSAIKSIGYLKDSLEEMGRNLDRMSRKVPDVEKHNPGLLDDISNTLKYGK